MNIFNNRATEVATRFDTLNIKDLIKKDTISEEDFLLGAKLIYQNLGTFERTEGTHYTILFSSLRECVDNNINQNDWKGIIIANIQSKANPDDKIAILKSVDKLFENKNFQALTSKKIEPSQPKSEIQLPKSPNKDAYPLKGILKKPNTQKIAQMETPTVQPIAKKEQLEGEVLKLIKEYNGKFVELSLEKKPENQTTLRKLSILITKMEFAIRDNDPNLDLEDLKVKHDLCIKLETELRDLEFAERLKSPPK